MSNSPRSIELKKNLLYTFFVTELTEDQKGLILLHKNQGTLDVASAILGIDCRSIILIGSSNKITTANIGNYIGSFEGPDQGYVSNSNNLISNRQIHYREYSFTLERQMKSHHLINHCPDRRMSVNSLKRVIKSEYCCLWKIKN